MALELPSAQKSGGLQLAEAKASSPTNRPRAAAADPSIPREFTCAINGHLMKEPVKSPGGHVFEKSTITLWLRMQGSVCPITGQPLVQEDLEPDEELKTRIMRWHIQRTTMQQEGPVAGFGSGDDDDDIYDF